MKFQIKAAREKAGFSQKELAKIIGVAPSTFNGYESGNHDPKSELLSKIAETCDVSVDFLLGRDSMPPPKLKKAPSLSDEAQKVATRYSKLDRYGKATVQAVLDEEEARVKEQAEMDEFLTKPEPKIIPLYWSAAAAGYASPILGDEYDLYELKTEDPQGAVFAVKVSGDSMEPLFRDGDIAFCNRDPMADGDIGVFCLDGDSFIKQYHLDRMMGMTYLFSLNRDRADADKLITRTSGQTLTCFGRVMTRRRYPLPR